MATTIDNKTVQMNFDNSNFERNISQSMKSLKDMDGQLQNMEKSKSLETLNKQAQKLDFSNMSKGLQDVKVHFSALQVAGATVIASLTKKVMAFGSSLVQNTIGQIKSGGLSRALNLDQAKFQIKGLGKEWEKIDKKTGKVVGGIKQDVLGAVSGTQYGLDEAARIASQLISSNVKEGKQLEGVLRSIAGVASMTNSTYGDIGNLYAKVAGNGRLMSQELLQLSAKGMNAAAIMRDYVNAHEEVRKKMIEVGKTSKGKGNEVAEFANKTKLTEQNIRTLASAGAIDFNSFAKAMENSFGKAASKANDTYAGSLANLKAALSRVGEEIQTPLYTKHLRKTYLDLIDLIDKMHIALGPLIKEINKIMNFTFKKGRGVIKMISKSMSTLDASTNKTKKLQKQIKKSEIYKQIKNISKGLDKVFKTIVKLGKNLYSFVLLPIYDLFKELGYVLKEAFFKDAKNGLSIFKTALNGVYKALKNVMLIINYVINSLFWMTKILKPILVPALQAISTLVKNIGSFLVNTFFNISEVIATNADMFTSWAENIMEVVNTIKPAVLSVWKFIKFVYTSITDGIKYIFNSIKSIDSGVFEGFINGLSIVSKWITNFIDKAIIIFGTLTPIFKALWNLATAVFSAIGNAISDLLKNMDSVKVNGFDNFVEGLKNIVQNIAEVINKIAELIRKTKILEVVTTILSSVFKGIGYVLTNLTKVFTYVLNGISKFFTKVREHFDIGKIFKSLINTIKSGVSNLIKFLNQNGDTVLKGSIFVLLITKLHNFIDMLKGTKIGELGTFVSTIKQFFTGIQDSIEDFKNKMVNIETLKAVAKSILMLAISLFILSGIPKDKLNTAITAIISLFSGLLIAFKQINQVKEISNDKKFVAAPVFKTLLGIATAVLILSAALKMLSKIKDADLLKGIAAISVLLTELVGALNYLTSNKESEKEIPEMAKVLLSLAVAVRILASAIAVLAKLNLEKLIVSAGIVAALLWELFKIVELLSTEQQRFTTGAEILLALAVAVRIIASAIKVLADIKLDNLIYAVIAVSGLLWELFGIIKLLTTEEEQFITGAATIIALAVGVRILAGAVAVLAKLPIEKLEQGLIAIGGLLASVAGFIILIDKYGSMSLKSAAGILLVAVAMRVLVASVKTLGNMNPEKLVLGLVVFIDMLMSLALALNAMEGTLNGSFALGVAAAAMIGLALSLKLLSTIPVEGLAVGLIAMAMSMYIMAKAAGALKGEIPSLYGVAGAMALLGVGMTLIGVGVLALALGLKAIIGLIVSLGKGLKDIIIALVSAIVESVKVIISGLADIMPDIIKIVIMVLQGIVQVLREIVPDLATTIVELLLGVLQTIATNIEPIIQAVIDIVIGIINGVASRVGDLFDAIGNLLGAIGTEIINALGQINPDDILKIVLAIGAIAIIFKVLSNMQTEAAKAIITVAFITVSLLMLTGVFALIGMIDNSLTEKLNAITVFLAVMTLVLIGCAIIGNFAAQALIGLGVLIVAIAAITAVMAILGALADKVEPFIDKGGPLLVKIGSFIGQFIGAFVAGVAIQAVQAIPALGEALGQFGQSIGPFISALNKMSLDALAKIGVLIAIVMAITATSFLSGITKFLSFGNDPIDEFISTIIKLGKGFKKFNATLDGVDASGASVAADVIAKLAIAANLIPSSGGWLQNIVGNKDLDGFGQAIVSLANGLKTFANSVDTSINVEELTPFVDLLKKIVEIADMIPRSGGWLQNIAGNKDLGNFGDDIKPLAEGIKKFGDEAVKIKDPAALDNIIGIIKKMVEVQNDLPKSGGLWQAIAGSEDWSSLSDGLTSMVDCFKEISKSLNGKDIKLDVIEQAVGILQNVAKVNNDAIKIGEKKDDSEDSDTFVAKILEPVKKAFTKVKEYQKSMKEEDVLAMIPYFDTIKEFIDELGSKFKDKQSQQNLETVKTLGDSLTNLLASVMKINELMSAKKGGGVSDDLNTKLTSFAQALVDFSNQMMGLNSQGIINAQSCTAYLSEVKDLKIGKFEDAKKSVENLQSMMESVKKLADPKNQITTGEKSQLETLKTYVKSIKSGLKSMAASLKEDGGIKKELKELSSFGKHAKTFSNGLEAVANAFKTISSTGVDKDKGTNVKDAMNEVATAGVDKFISGLKGKGKDDDIKNAFKALKKKTKKLAGEVIGKGTFVSIGQNLIDGIIAGINNRTEDLKKAMKFEITAAFKVTKKKAKINSPSKLWAEIGKGLMEGEALGVKNNVHLVKSALVDSVKQTSLITDNAIKDSASKFTGSYASEIKKGSKESMKKSYLKTGGALEPLFKYFYDPSRIKKVQGSAKMLVGSAQQYLKNAAKTLYEATNPDQAEDEKAQERAIQNRINKNKKTIQKFTKKKGKYHKIYKKWQSKKGQKKTKYYNKHKKTLKKYTSAKDKLKKARDEKKDLRKTIRDNRTSAWQDLGNAIKDNARSFMDPLAQAIDYGLNLFDKFERGQRISAGRMLANYASNVKGIEKYNNALATLKNNVSPEMYADLKSKGISALPQIEAINRMSNQQLNDLKVYEATNNRQKFENMLQNLKDRITQAKSWKEKIVELTKRGLNKEALQEILNMGIEEAGPYLDALLSADYSEIKQFNDYFKIARNTETEMARVGQASYAKSATVGVSKAANEKAGKKAAWNYGAGLIKGLKDKKKNKQVSEAAYKLADQVVKAVNKRLGIKSPAKEGAKAMMYVALGMVKGAADNLSLAQNAGEDLADAVLKPLQSMETAQNVIDENPTITPVLDLDRLERDMNELNDMFNSAYTLGVTADIANGKKLAAQNTNNGDIINNYNNQFTQNNYSPEPLDRVGIYRDTKGWINSKMKGGVATT